MKKGIILFVWFFVVLLVQNKIQGQSMYMHTNRSTFVSGDMAFFKLYYFTQPSDLTANSTICVDLISKNNWITGEIFPVNGNLISGYLTIPDTLSSGNYQLRVYPAASKNKANHPVLGQKHIFVTNRFTSNNDLVEVNYYSEQKALNNVDDSAAVCEVSLLKDTLLTREKNAITIKPLSLPKSDSLFVSISVKPLNKFEQRIHQQNNKTIAPEKFSESTTTIVSSFGHGQPALFLSGKILQKKNRQPVNKAILFLSFPDTVLRFRYAFSESSGHFCFSLPQGYRKSPAYLSAFAYPELKPLNNIVFQLDDPFIKNTAKHWEKEVYHETLQNPDSLNVKKAVIKKAYQIKSLKKTQETNQFFMPYENKFMLGELTDRVLMDDYINLPDFYEIAREILPFVRFRVDEGNYQLYVIDGEMKLLRANPMVWMDGVAITNLERIADLGTTELKAVEVKSTQRFYGDLFLENGAVLIWSDKNRFWEENSMPGVQKINIKNFQSKVYFQFPEYKNKENATKPEPDFRQTLYWNPDIKFSGQEQKSISFYTGDGKGQFLITLIGVTSSGKIVKVNKKFVVE